MGAIRGNISVVFVSNPQDGGVVSYDFGATSITLTARTTPTLPDEFEIGTTPEITVANYRDALTANYTDYLAVAQSGTRAVAVSCLDYNLTVSNITTPTNVEAYESQSSATTSQLDFWFLDEVPNTDNLSWDVNTQSTTSYSKTSTWTIQDPLVESLFYGAGSSVSAAQAFKQNLDSFNSGEGFSVTTQTFTDKTVVSLIADEAGTSFSGVTVGGVAVSHYLINVAAPPVPPTGVRFSYEFSSIDGEDYKVTVYDDEYLGQPVEMIGSRDPFVIEYPSFDPFETQRGSGAKLSFIYEGNESFMRDMFDTKLTRFPVFLTRADNTLPNNIEVVWSGFLNSELYEEEFSDDGETLGILYNLTANDGIAILKEIPLFNDTSNDLVTPYDIVTQAINKVVYFDDNAPTNYELRVHEDYLLDDYVYEEVFDNLYINTSNFIDEDGVYKEAGFCIDSCLKPFRLSVIKQGNVFYILPISAKASLDSLLCKRYIRSNSGVWQQFPDINTSTAPFSVGLGDYYQTGQSLSYNTGISSQRISVDGYSERDLFPNELDNESKYEEYVGQEVMGTSEDYGWSMTSYEGHQDFTFTTVGNTTAFPIVVTTEAEHKVSPEESLPVALVKNPNCIDVGTAGHIDGLTGDNGLVITSKKLMPRTMASNPPKLLLNMELMFMERIEEYLHTVGTWPTHIPGYEIGCMLKVGDYYLQSTHFSETLNNSENYIFFKKTLSWVLEPSTFAVCISKPLNQQVESEQANGKWAPIYNYGKSQLGVDVNDSGDIYKSLFEPLEIPVPPNMTKWTGVGNRQLEPIEVEFGISNYVALRWYQYNYDGAAKGMRRNTIPFSFSLDAFMVKNLTIEFSSDTDENTKVEFELENEESFRDKGQDIDLTLGTSNRTDVLQRGCAFARRYPSGGNPAYYIPLMEDETFGGNLADAGKFFINNDSENKSMEELLMDSIVANRFAHTTSISADLKWPQYTPIDLLTFETLTGQKMEFGGGSINVWEGSIEGTWNEIKGD